MNRTVNHDHLAAWLSRLVQIPSVSPACAGSRSGEPGEGRIAAALADWFGQLGGEVHIHKVLPGRPNVYGIWRGASDRWLGVDVHTDTVGVEHMQGDPFDGRVENGRVYGRGAVDTKATLGILLALLAAIQHREERLPHNLIVAATVDEEIGAAGAPAFAAWLRDRGMVIDQLLVAEPTGCRPIHGHKGVCRLQFEIQGRAAHSSQPEQGQNAITAAARVVVALAAEDRRLQETTSPLGSPSLTVSLIEGGVGINVVPDRCRFSIDRRLVVGESAAGVAAAIRLLVAETSPLPVTTQPLLAVDPFFQPPDTPWLRQLAAWSGQETATAPYGTNAWAYADVARECAIFGPGAIDQAHGAEEWVTLDELARAATIYEQWLEIVG